MLFYLGTHRRYWLARAELADVPLFVSRRILAARHNVPRAAMRWALDSGGFTELSLFGEWRTTPAEYAADVLRFAEEAGRLDWAAPQDWMNEPVMLAKTGLTVAEHQRRTVENFLDLRQRLGALVIPVVQGWERDDYLRCWELYAASGVELERERVVGLGTVCRREATADAAAIVQALQPLRLHGFGVKKAGLAAFGGTLASADSMAWSYGGRINGKGARGATHGLCGLAFGSEEHPANGCQNCLKWALLWRSRILKETA